VTFDFDARRPFTPARYWSTTADGSFCTRHGIAQEPATALLIVDLDKHIGNARAWRDTFGVQLPDLEIRIWPDAGNLATFRRKNSRSKSLI
jgi:hypothetical protein